VRCRACCAAGVAAISWVRFWIRVLWIRQGLRNQQWLAVLVTLEFSAAIARRLRSQKTPLNTPVNLRIAVKAACCRYRCSCFVGIECISLTPDISNQSLQLDRLYVSNRSSWQHTTRSETCEIEKRLNRLSLNFCHALTNPSHRGCNQFILQTINFIPFVYAMHD
jgi:hypothetical protein